MQRSRGKLVTARAWSPAVPRSARPGRVACWSAVGLALCGTAGGCGGAARERDHTPTANAQPAAVDPTTAFLREATPLFRIVARLGFEQARVLSHPGPQASLRDAQLDSLRNLARAEAMAARELRQLDAPAGLRRPTLRLAGVLAGDARSLVRLLASAKGPATHERIAAYGAVARSAGLVKSALQHLAQVVTNS